MHKGAPFREDDAERVKILKSLEVLDTDSENKYDSITEAVAKMFNTPIALVSLVDGERQWFKSNVGIPECNQTHRDLAFCAHVVYNQDLLLVEDATKDERFMSSDLVTGFPGIRFYAGAPLTLETENIRHTLGSICVIDTKPRTLDEHEKRLMHTMAEEVTRRLLEHRADENQALQAVTSPVPEPDAETKAAVAAAVQAAAEEAEGRVGEGAARGEGEGAGETRVESAKLSLLPPPEREEEEEGGGTGESRSQDERQTTEEAELEALGHIQKVDYFMFEEFRRTRGFDDALSWLKATVESRRGRNRSRCASPTRRLSCMNATPTPSAASDADVETDNKVLAAQVPEEKRGLLYTDAAHSVLPASS